VKRLNIATLVGASAVAAGLALSPFGAALAHAEDNKPDRDGYMECIDQQPDGPDGREDDYTIQTCCILHDGSVEQDYDGTIWCNIPAAVEDVQQPSAPTGTVRPPRVLDPAVIAPAGQIGLTAKR
jgi:hypothetical protein